MNLRLYCYQGHDDAAVSFADSAGESQAGVFAQQTFLAFQHNLPEILKGCSSGRELVEQGFEVDVHLAAALNSGICAPRLIKNVYICDVSP
jgi:2-phosphosulfolactate phosphatase